MGIRLLLQRRTAPARTRTGGPGRPPLAPVRAVAPRASALRVPLTLATAPRHTTAALRRLAHRAPAPRRRGRPAPAPQGRTTPGRRSGWARVGRVVADGLRARARTVRSAAGALGTRPGAPAPPPPPAPRPSGPGTAP
ncbi:hypothetical protein VM636_22910 [Streptomyces sp. SCSIO 75703]|uniref:hypothetical protein n=1 Tax=unclassified Streptomyces TaxID=2593676 RepID=UPI0006B637BA|nr:hypothetical protein [Streptomyces sp. TP-A0875]